MDNLFIVMRMEDADKTSNFENVIIIKGTECLEIVSNVCKTLDIYKDFSKEDDGNCDGIGEGLEYLMTDDEVLLIETVLSTSAIETYHFDMEDISYFKKVDQRDLNKDIRLKSLCDFIEQKQGSKGG